MKPSKRQLAIEARRAADPIAQKVGRTDIDYTDPDTLPTAPRVAPAEPSMFTRSPYLVLGKQTPLLAVLKKRYPDARWAEQKNGPLARINVDELIAMEPDPVEKAWLESLG